MDIKFKDLLPHEKITLRAYELRLKQGKEFGKEELALFSMANDILLRCPEISMYDVPVGVIQKLEITDHDYAKDIPF